jgi:hypothetical protein
LGKVIALEHPELSSVCLDFSPSEQANDALLLLEELLSPPLDKIGEP